MQLKQSLNATECPHIPRRPCFLLCHCGPCMWYILESTGYRDVRFDVPRCLPCKYTNANTQIQCMHKHSEWWNVIKPYEVLYFWKALDTRMPDVIFRVVNHANKKCKYTNTVYTQIKCTHKYPNLQGEQEVPQVNSRKWNISATNGRKWNPFFASEAFLEC